MSVMPDVADLNEGARLLAGGDSRAAVPLLRAALDAGGLPPEVEADGRYMLGRALGESGDREGRAAEWVQVLRLDAVAAGPPALLSPGEFESIAEAALDTATVTHHDTITQVPTRSTPNG
jgi:hypothetical protein